MVLFQEDKYCATIKISEEKINNNDRPKIYNITSRVTIRWRQTTEYWLTSAGRSPNFFMSWKTKSVIGINGISTSGMELLIATHKIFKISQINTSVVSFRDGKTDNVTQRLSNERTLFTANQFSSGRIIFKTIIHSWPGVIRFIQLDDRSVVHTLELVIGEQMTELHNGIHIQLLLVWCMWYNHHWIFHFWYSGPLLWCVP